MGKSVDEVISLLQKGANYDNTPVHKLIDKYAEANGMNRQEYIKFLEDQLPSLAENIQRNKVSSEHPEWDDEKVELAVKLNLKEMNTARAEKEQKEKETVQEYRDIMRTKQPDTCSECGLRLSDGGICPVCHDGEEDC